MSVCITHIYYYTQIEYRHYKLNSINTGEINQKSHTWEPLARVMGGGEAGDKNKKIHLILSKVLSLLSLLSQE